LDIAKILAELNHERDGIEQAIRALQGSSTTNARAKGRKRGTRVMSAEARARIGAAMKKSWAERKRAEKKAA
jgi:hypothetical protein